MAGAIRKVKRHYYDFFCKKIYRRDAAPMGLKSYASQISQKMSDEQVDVVFSATANSIAYLKCDQPIVFWADATFAGISELYPHYRNLCQESIEDWDRMERSALEICSLAIYASDWAAQTAISDYGADPRKVKVVPFGANINGAYTFEEVKDLVSSRPNNCCRLLFIGVDWERKGEVAVQVARQMNSLGLKTELTIVGCKAPIEEPIPDYIKQLGFIRKSSPEGIEQIKELIAKSHFLIVPSQAECDQRSSFLRSKFNGRSLHLDKYWRHSNYY